MACRHRRSSPCPYCGSVNCTEDEPACDEAQAGGFDEHEHQWGPLEQSRFAGTIHRKCQVPGCKVISLDDDD